MVNLSIESNLLPVEERLQELGLYIPKLQKKIIQKITAKGKSKLRSAYRRSGLQSKSGKLYAAIYGKAKTEDVGYLGIASKQHYKALPNIFGADIYPKNSDYLRFQVNGEWKTVRSVHIPAHNFWSAAENYINSAEMQKDIDSVVEKEIDRMFRL